MTTTPRKVYLARAGANGEDEEFAVENHLAIIGFTDVPTLATAKDYDDVFKVVEQVMPGAKPRAIGNRAGQVWAFSVAMKPGNIVVMPRKLTSQIALGIVSGPYEFRKVREQFRHTRPVKWVRPDVARTVFSQDLLYSFGAFMTVCNIARNDAERRVGAILDGKPDPGFLQQLVDVTVYRTLQGSMQSYKADQGLLVAWGGFNKVVLAEAKQGHFFVRLWGSRDLVEAVYRNYEHLPAEIQADLPLKRVWMLVPEDRDA